MDKRKREPFDPWLIPPEPQSPPVPTAAAPLTVSQITASIRQAISRSLPPTVHVVGQISNLKRHTSGHLYFSLKDAQSELPCVMWRTDAAKLKFQLSDGLEVVATGGIEVFDRAGRYQLYVRRLEPRGVGTLELAVRQMHTRLAAEGLFDPARKRTPPKYPRRIGVVTSPTGAAIADILRTITQRYCCVHILVAPVKVQGPGAAAEIAGAIRMLNANAKRLGGIDVLIVGRGGGSLEDLWAFNEEVVARAIFSSAIPVISGVGHEVDTTIADLVADVRAATPTAAAQLAVPSLDDVLAALVATESRILRGMKVLRQACEFHLRALVQRSPFREPLSMIRLRAQVVDMVSLGMRRSNVQNFLQLRNRLDGIERSIRRIAPHQFLAELSARMARLAQRLRESIWRANGARLAAAESASRRLERTSPAQRMPLMRHRVQQGELHLSEAGLRTVKELTARLDAAAGLLQAVSHKSVLRRGYSITRRGDDRRLIRSVAEVQPKMRVFTELPDGQFESSVDL